MPGNKGPERQAAVDAGHSRFSTGRPCNKGHVSERYTNNGSCVMCAGVTDQRSISRAYKADPERFAAYRAKYKLSNAIGNLLRSAKQRAKKRGYEFSISRDDITIPANCPCCGGVVVVNTSTKRAFRRSPSLDRIDSTKGYIASNVAVICWNCNNLKGSATADELEMVARWVRSLNVGGYAERAAGKMREVA